MRRALPPAYVAHAATGRTRVRVPSRQGDTQFFSASAARLSEIEGVLAVQSRALTASLLIEHEADCFEMIAEQAANDGLFFVAEFEDEPDAGTRLAVPAIAGLLGALGIVQLFRSNVLPPAITLLWYAGMLARDGQSASESAASTRSQGRSRSRRPS